MDFGNSAATRLTERIMGHLKKEGVIHNFNAVYSIVHKEVKAALDANPHRVDADSERRFDFNLKPTKKG